MAAAYQAFQGAAPVASPFTRKKPASSLGVFPGPAQFAFAGAPKPVSSVSAPTASAAPAARPPAPAPPANTGAAPSTSQPSTAVDYGADPILAQIRVLGQQSVPNALAQADAARKQLLVGFGDPALARSTVFGGKGFSVPGIAGGPDFSIADTSHVGDEGSASAAEQNPYSTLARLLYAHQGNDTSIDETRNRENLFYSGARANDLSSEQHQFGQNRADAYTAVAQALSQIDAQVQAAYQAEADRQTQGERDAYLRAVAGAVSNPGGGQGASAPVGPTPGQLAQNNYPYQLQQAQDAKARISSPGGRGGR